jgi:hydrogenase nickel incorporation protein HypA/HybF
VHEYAIVQALLERVDAEARGRQAIAVHGLSVRVGELSGLDPELFTTAFDTFREGTSCAHASLRVDRVPARWACPSCGEGIAAGAVLACPRCGVPARLMQGDEILLDTIDLEVP